jgi:hypothetical protein
VHWRKSRCAKCGRSALSTVLNPFLSGINTLCDVCATRLPNVVYSCGSLLHGRQLIIAYGMSDYATTFATLWPTKFWPLWYNPNDHEFG